MHILRPAAFRPGRGSHNFQGLMGWTNAEVDEMHSDLDINLLESIMADHQSQRERLMGSDRPYIMLGPIWVSSEYRSRGVGGKLIEKGFAMAQDAGVPLLLSGVFPNALPAYLHLGFEPLEGYGDLMVWWPQGVPKARLEGGKLVD
jgi:GNAT superfamily N-acetyltransferase